MTMDDFIYGNCSGSPTKEVQASAPVEADLLPEDLREALKSTPEKESPSVSVVVNKSSKYPVLNDILNSPRKRTATKKVREKRKRVSNLSATPLRSEMTMVDLIYYNPSGSPMKEVQAPAPVEADLLPEDDPQPSTEDTENSNIGPKVIINDDGEIILDESSLFVRRKDTIDHSIAAVIENDNTTYSSYRNRCTKTWSKRETVKFYKALSLVGTDFALMENIFREDEKVTRTRRELKLKFKREEKRNPKFVHIAVYELQTYDFDILDDDQDVEFLDESEIIDAPKQVKRTVNSESVHGVGDESGEVTNLSSEVLQNDNGSNSHITLQEEIIVKESSPNTIQKADDEIEKDKREIIEKVQDLDIVNMVSNEENARNLNAVECMNKCNSNQLSEEYSVILTAKADSECLREEVVITSDEIPRRIRRKVLPSIMKRSKRPSIQPLLPPRRTSFASFTPVEAVFPKSPVLNRILETSCSGREIKVK